MEAKLVDSYLTLVNKIACSIHRSIDGAVEIDELVSMGVLALLEAARRRDATAGSFLSYAYLRIDGGIRDNLGNTAALPRKAHRLRRAGKLLFDPRRVDPGALAANGRCPTARIDGVRATRALARLPRRLGWLLLAIYFHDRSLTEVASELGLSVSRVSRLRDEGLGRLRDMLEPAA